MNICEVGDKLVSGMGGGKAIGIGGELRVVALVCEERHGSGGRTFRVIVCEFCDSTAWNEAYIMLVSCIDYALDMTCIQSVSQCFIVCGIL